MTPRAGTASTASTVARAGTATAATPLRADAARNVAQIRAAAIAAFHGRGLGTPLEEIATAAGVSKATIYNRFGGRQGLIDAVIEDLVGAEMRTILDRARQPGDPWERLATYIADVRDLQYREPAAVDVHLMTYPGSAEVTAQWKAGRAAGIALVKRAHEAGVLRADFTADDLYQALVANGLALRHRPKPKRGDYDRRGRFLLDSLRPAPDRPQSWNRAPTVSVGPGPMILAAPRGQYS
jgi:AcrR family transcriptional regulator